MKKQSYAEMATKAFSKYILDDAALKKLHACLLIITDDVDKACRKYSIKYMLSGGSCLGAVRHKGFIPWDDDVDVMMYEQDVKRLADAMKTEYGDKYVIVPPLDGVGGGRMMKIFLAGTTYTEIGKENYPKEKGVFVDVFPIIDMPPAKKRTTIAKKHRLAARMYSYGLISKYPSPVIKDAARVDKSLKKYYNIRKSIGFAARIFGLKFWFKKLKKYEKGYAGVSDEEGIPSGIDYEREVFPKGFFSDVTEAEFEGRRYYIPAQYDRYLKNLYGDYMRLPPPEKRGRHYASAVDFGKYDTIL